MTICPTCGGVTHYDGPRRLSVRSGRVYYAGEPLDARPAEHRLIAHLAEHGMASHDDLVVAAMIEGEDPLATLTSLVCNARLRLRGTHVRIKSVAGWGYRIEGA